MSILLTKSHSNARLQKTVKTATVVSREGMVLARDYESGEEVVVTSAGTAGEDIVGFSMSDNETIDTTVRMESQVVPSASPYTVQLDKTTPVSGQTFITGQTIGNPANANEYSVSATGLVTFHSGQAGVTHEIRYKYSLTVSEAKDMFYQRNINNVAGAELSTIAVMCGKGEIYTDQYDASKTFTAGDVYAAASGLCTDDNTGTLIGKVIHYPTTSSPFLGVSFNI